ncbi:hypothetical protein J7T55_005811 [Diaporthe amygdali]|uniref:uncharacterized protein n=1 Tax=Phomopsis amygdali TaxID=1214568 RepID=UPI0022FDFF16|nr:uncharacterized protein J7T55_005811 [Diaporthe amygdali]KAJ0124473.1 hypothetical protein J7T55_005811 [Diaporthe amygdali]
MARIVSKQFRKVILFFRVFPAHSAGMNHNGISVFQDAEPERDQFHFRLGPSTIYRIASVSKYDVAMETKNNPRLMEVMHHCLGLRDGDAASQSPGPTESRRCAMWIPENKRNENASDDATTAIHANNSAVMFRQTITARKDCSGKDAVSSKYKMSPRRN